MIITKFCEITQSTNSMNLDITQEEYNSFLSKKPTERDNIQDIFPNLTDDEREFLITGLTPEDWNNIFSDEEEE